MRTCGYCQEPNHRHPNARYCSPECKSKAYSARKLAARHEGLEDRKCAECLTPIPSRVSPRARFCQKSCGIKWHNRLLSAARTDERVAARADRGPCAYCGEPIPLTRKTGALYCSPDCKKAVNDAAWRANSPTYMRRYHYGITDEQWEAQLAAQDYRCVVCRSGEWPGKDNRPHADHDHSLPTFILRGIPCGKCNTGVGQFDDDPVRLIAAARYLLTAKASPSGAGVPCDDLVLLGGALRALAADDPGLLRAAAVYLEAVPVS